MDAGRFMAVVEQQVLTSNPTLFERVIDKEVFERVYKGVRQGLGEGFKVERLVGPEAGVAEIELQAKIREISRKMMKQLNFAEDDENPLEERK